MKDSRDATIDVLRGIAVFTMIPANFSALLFAEPHPFWFRLSGSFAAPLFVLLSGYMVALNAGSGKHGIGYFAVRMLMIFGVAAFIDACIWRVIPFMTWDVLYTIALSALVIPLFRKLPSAWARWAIVLAVFAAAPLLQRLLGYADYPTEIYFNPDDQVELPANKSGVLQNILVDGWFPLFPWLGFGLLGSMLADLRAERDGKRSLGKWALPAGLLICAGGAALWYFQPGALIVREGYSELFYPPVPGFILTSIGLTLVLFSLVDLAPGLALYQPLRLLGEAALLMYILHQAANQYLLSGWWPEKPLGTFLLIVLGAEAVLMTLGIGIRALKSAWPGRPMPVRFLIGG